jgi:hypothetical protein
VGLLKRHSYACAAGLLVALALASCADAGGLLVVEHLDAGRDAPDDTSPSGEGGSSP